MKNCKWVVGGLLGLGVIVVHGTRVQGQAADASVKPISEIRLQRYLSVSNASPTTIRLKADGTIEHEVKSGKLSTRKVGSLNRRDFARLAELVERSGFSKLEDRYSSGRTHDWMYVTTVKRGAVAKTVHHYGDSGPAELWAIERAILGLQSDASWAE